MAYEYPLGKLMNEAHRVRVREDMLEARRSMLLHMSVGALFSKEGLREFKDEIKRLQE